MSTAVCELGPAAIRRFGCGALSSAIADPVLADAALDGGDGRFVLVEERPQAVGAVWQAALQPLLDGADRAMLIHPSWWPAPRITTVRRAVGEMVGDTELMPRWRVLTQPHRGGTVVVEIAPHMVVVLRDGAPIAARSRSAPTDVLACEIAGVVAPRYADHRVIVDAAPQVAGAETLSRLLVARLSAARSRAVIAGSDQLVSAAQGLVVTAGCPAVTEIAPGRTRLRWAYTAAAAAGIIAVAGLSGDLWSLGGADRRSDSTNPQGVTLIEGRVALQVPAGWVVRRVTDGPGSARVEVRSPVAPDEVLHLTQSRVAAADLAATATALRSAVDAEPAGVFVDFNPSDTHAGRAAVTYREVRSGRDIRWTVLVDGDLRISIGCQYATGGAASVAAACDDAVRSARRVR